MSKRDIHIERLQIRMRGVSAQTARATVADLGHELLSQLSTHRALDGMRGRVRINKIDAGTEHVDPGTPVSELRQRIAKQVAGSFLPQKRKDAK